MLIERSLGACGGNSTSCLQVLGRGRAHHAADIDASVLHRFFDDKVAGVRVATAGAAAPQFTAAPVGCKLRVFSPVTLDDVAATVRTLPDKQCSSDQSINQSIWRIFIAPLKIKFHRGAYPLPTRLLKATVDILAPFLSHLFC